jgi:hypothetical protein
MYNLLVEKEKRGRELNGGGQVRKEMHDGANSSRRLVEVALMKARTSPVFA